MIGETVSDSPTSGLFKSILKHEVQKALGCTEPGAVAFAAAIAAQVLKDGGKFSPDNIEKVWVTVCPGVMKNGAAVTLPGTEGQGIGLPLAAALGVLAANPDGLNTLQGVDAKAREQAACLVCQNHVGLSSTEGSEFFIEVKLEMKNGVTSEVQITGGHTHVASVKKNEKDVPWNSISENGNGTSTDVPLSDLSYRERLRKCSFEDLIAMAGELSIKDARYVKLGVDMNLRLAKVGLEMGRPAVASLQKMVIHNVSAPSLETNIKLMVAAATSARMGGADVPAMSSGGSGNQGVDTTLPPYLFGKDKNIPEDRILKSIALAHIINAYCKAFFGDLAPACGCAVSAGLGATAAIAYQINPTLEAVTCAIQNLTAMIAGMLCDGASEGCAAKVVVAADAILWAGCAAGYGDNLSGGAAGIVGKTAEETIKNLNRVIQGMLPLDPEINDVIRMNAGNVHRACFKRPPLSAMAQLSTFEV